MFENPKMCKKLQFHYLGVWFSCDIYCVFFIYILDYSQYVFKTIFKIFIIIIEVVQACFSLLSSGFANVDAQLKNK